MEFTLVNTNCVYLTTARIPIFITILNFDLEWREYNIYMLHEMWNTNNIKIYKY